MRKVIRKLILKYNCVPVDNSFEARDKEQRNLSLNKNESIDIYEIHVNITMINFCFKNSYFHCLCPQVVASLLRSF